MVYRDQSVNVNQSDGVVRLTFADVSLEMSYRQADDVVRQLLRHSKDGRRAHPPVLTKGDRVRCLYGRQYGKIGTLLSVDDTGRCGVAFASNIVGSGYAPHELELAGDSE